MSTAANEVASPSTAKESTLEIPATADYPTASNFSAFDDYRSICFNGETFELTRKQAGIVKVLHKAFKRGTPSVDKLTLLAAVESETSQMRDLFKHSPLWQKLVVSGKRRGTYRLNLTAQE